MSPRVDGVAEGLLADKAGFGFLVGASTCINNRANHTWSLALARYSVRQLKMRPSFWDRLRRLKGPAFDTQFFPSTT